MKDNINFKDLPDPNNRYVLEKCMGVGVYGKVFRAKDTQAGGKCVAIKIQRLNDKSTSLIQEEYTILRDFSQHSNLPEFYGIYKFVVDNIEEIWFVMELCEGGPVTDLVGGLMVANRRMAEEHIAFILKELVKALIYLHENKVMHRDIKGSNILLTKDGEIKLVDFGLSRVLKSTLGKTSSYTGSPNWMAPEVIICSSKDKNDDGYDNRVDVWSLGIVALELANGKPPFQGMHPTRAIFQITRNPPPILERPGNWSETFNDFINECLVKNPEHRPYVMELLEHPFLSSVPENNYYLTQELKMLCQNFNKTGEEARVPEAVIQSSLLKREENQPLEQMLVEDLSTLDTITEEIILQELQDRMTKGRFCTFVGDILIVLNPNEQQDIFENECHLQYKFKSRSDNAPHIFSVADSAYQAALHHETTQNILLSGESCSGKTTNYLHIVDHLLYLGQNNNINQERIKSAIKLIHAFIHASTPTNDYSTRAVFQTEITYGNTGKNTGARFEVNQIEKWRISSMDMAHSNFHILYYFYDGIRATGELNKYQLNGDRSYRYLRIPENCKSNNQPRDYPKQNVKKYQKIQEIFKEFEFTDEQIETILSTLAAVITLGEVRFSKTQEETVEIVNKEYAINAAQLLKIDEKKFIWTLTNYCVINEGVAVRKSHSNEEARDARDSLANTLYVRILQYIINVINNKLSYGMAIFGEKYSIKILDLYGFECFKHNHLSQFLINCTNEQLQYHYLQRVFGWETLEANEENIAYKSLDYYNNNDALDEMLGKCSVLTLIDDASKQGRDGGYVTERLQDQERIYISKINGSEFCINHYTGKVTYDSKEMPDRNRSFLPPDIIETLRCSQDDIIKLLFKSKLSKSGNLHLNFIKQGSQKGKNNLKQQPYIEQNLSQTRNMKTAAVTFRAFSIELLRNLSTGSSTGGTHFIRCIRSDLEGNARGFHKEIVRQQLRAMAVLETAEVRKRGLSQRISFSEFLRRYKFLAFDFDENVEINKDNCRLLLVRLKMEGWVMGKTKVFLKYYNEEYLSRLYETQVKKVIKIQSMIRSYLAKRRIISEIKQIKKVPKTQEKNDLKDLTKEDAAALVVQRAYREYSGRKACEKFSTEEFDEELVKFIRTYYNKWRTKSVFQILLQYRAARYQDLYNLAQQVHLYNQNVMNVALQQFIDVDLERIDSQAQVNTWLGNRKPSVIKLPFRLDEVPYFDTSSMYDPLETTETSIHKEESWDAPFRWKEKESYQMTSSRFSSSEDFEVSSKHQNQLIELPYHRNPSEPIPCLSTSITSFEEKQNETDESKYHEKAELDNDHLVRINNITTTPANKDFEYIRAPSVSKPLKNKAGPVNPIIELEIKGRRQSFTSEDDPPFNFQAMLRKTNFNRESIKREKEINEKISLKKVEKKNLINLENKESDNDVFARDSNLNLNTNNKATSTEEPHPTDCDKSPKQKVGQHENKKNVQIDKSADSKINVTKKDTNQEKSDTNMKEPKITVTFHSVFTSTEIAPGIFLEGTMVEI